MSKYYWSASARGFLNDDVNVGELPTDAVEITYQEWQDLLNGQLVGSIRSDEQGRPYIKINENGGKSNAVYEAEAKKIALATMASQAIGTLQDAVDLEMATDEEKAQLIAWRKYRVLLTRVDTSTAPDIDWPQAPTT